MERTNNLTTKSLLMLLKPYTDILNQSDDPAALKGWVQQVFKGQYLERVNGMMEPETTGEGVKRAIVATLMLALLGSAGKESKEDEITPWDIMANLDLDLSQMFQKMDTMPITVTVGPVTNPHTVSEEFCAGLALVDDKSYPIAMSGIPVSFDDFKAKYANPAHKKYKLFYNGKVYYYNTTSFHQGINTMEQWKNVPTNVVSVFAITDGGEVDVKF